MNLLVVLAAVLVFSLVVLAMAVGVMAGRKPIAGSCGGIATLRERGVTGADGPVCEMCGAKPDEQCKAEDGGG